MTFKGGLDGDDEKAYLDFGAAPVKASRSLRQERDRCA
jgi:hypothetical protein